MLGSALELGDTGTSEYKQTQILLVLSDILFIIYLSLLILTMIKYTIIKTFQGFKFNACFQVPINRASRPSQGTINGGAVSK